jgi:hypothetical protein
MRPCACGCGDRVAGRYRRGHGRRRPIVERLAALTVESGDCLHWTGAVTTSGYGRIGIDGERTEYVHRVAYRLHVGPIPPGLHIDHLCMVRLCVRPSHLEAVTQAENNRRAAESRRLSRVPTDT